MLIKCNECDKEYSSQAKACVHCGAKNAQAPMGGGAKAGLWVVGLVAGFFVILLLVGQYESRPEVKEKRLAQGVKKNICAMAQAGQVPFDECEKASNEYFSKYGVD